MNCFKCGTELKIDANFMRSEYGMLDDDILLGEDGQYPLDPDDDGLVATYDCPECGIQYVVGATSENEKKTTYRNYWYPETNKTMEETTEMIIQVEPGMEDAVKYALSRVKGVINVEDKNERE